MKLTQIKTIGTVLLVVLFLLSLGNNGCQRNKAIDLAKQLTGLDFKNSILRQSITKKDSLIGARNYEIDSLSIIINDLKDKAKILKVHGDVLQADLREIKDSLINVPTDSSYAFLQAVYPYPGEFKYPFNEPQVRNIHLDYLENRNLWGVTNNLKLQINNCQDIIAANYERTAKYSNQIDNYKSQKGSYEKIIKNKDKENELLKGEAKTEKKKKGFWKITSGILAGLAILIAI